VRHRLDRSLRIQRDPGTSSELAYPSQRAVQVQACLRVHNNQLTPRLDVARQQLVGLHAHEVGLERRIYLAATGRDHVGTECQVGRKPAVHDVPLDAVDPGRGERSTLLAEASLICGQDGRHDQRLVHHAASSMDLSPHPERYCLGPGWHLTRPGGLLGDLASDPNSRVVVLKGSQVPCCCWASTPTAPTPVSGRRDVAASEPCCFAGLRACTATGKVKRPRFSAALIRVAALG